MQFYLSHSCELIVFDRYQKSAILAPLHFAKVLIARRATTFGKVDYSDYQ